MSAGSKSQKMFRTEDVRRIVFSKMRYSCNIANALTGKHEDRDEKSVIFWKVLSVFPHVVQSSAQQYFH